MTDISKITEAARTWCGLNAGWLPIYLIPDHETLVKTWEELTIKQKRFFTSRMKPDGYARFWYEEYGPKSYKAPIGYIGEDGHFSSEMPAGNHCIVFKLGAKHYLVVDFFLDLLEERITRLIQPGNTGTYARGFTEIPAAIRSGIVFYSRGWGWRTRKNWQITLQERRSGVMLVALLKNKSVIPGPFMADKITPQNNQAGR